MRRTRLLLLFVIGVGMMPVLAAQSRPGPGEPALTARDYLDIEQLIYKYGWALDSGRLAHATLDVFREEPLPPEHPFWKHPRITVTPHVASETRPETAAESIARNIRRGEDRMPFLHVVDRAAGY